SANGMGPVEREKLRQVDLEISGDLPSLVSVLEIPNLTSGPRAGLGPRRANQSEKPASRSILTVPIVIDSETAGVMLLYQRGGRRWSTQVKNMAQAAASTVSLTIHHFRSQEQAIHAADREALTNRLLSAIRNALCVDEILKVAVEGIGMALKVSRVVIYKHRDGK